MRPKSITYSGVSASAYPWVPVDYMAQYDLSYHVVKEGTGDVVFAVDFTLNDFRAQASAVAVTATAGASGTIFSTLGHPVTGVRVRVASVSGASNLTFKLVQG